MVQSATKLDPELTKFDDYLRFGTDEERSKDTNTSSKSIKSVES